MGVLASTRQWTERNTSVEFFPFLLLLSSLRFVLGKTQSRQQNSSTSPCCVCGWIGHSSSSAPDSVQVFPDVFALCRVWIEERVE